MKKKLGAILILTSLIVSSNMNFAQTFTLGTTVNFELFTGSGAITNTGTSTITGNIGTNLGAITGFETSVLNGNIYTENTTTETAKADVLFAYTVLSAVPSTVSSHAPAFGSNENLTAGVYTILGAGSLAGNLTLDGMGNDNSIFIFRFSGAFSSGAASSIILINGARACNIYWVADGAVSLAATTSFQGTVIVKNAAIAIGASCVIKGRFLTTTGAITLDGDTAFLPDCTGAPIVLSSPPIFKPDFGSTNNFILFSSVGTISNSGTSNLIGDIGADNGVISGFETASITGAFFSANSITEEANVDLLSLYNQLITAPMVNNSHAATFGNGEILHTGVYTLGSAGSVAGEIIFDAQGDPNAQFIIRIGGALTIPANSFVTLRNSASSCSVFFVVEGAITIGATSQMKGTFLSNNGAITLGAGSDLKGRLYTTGGAITFNASEGYNAEQCFNSQANPTGLPIELVSFSSDCTANGTELTWWTASEYNNDYFSIFRSTDGNQWETIAQIDGAGNSKELLKYSYMDKFTNNSAIYYHLKQTDFDGRFDYSNNIAQKNCTEVNSKFSIFPNPTNGMLNLTYVGNKEEVTGISIFTLLGKCIYYSDVFQSKITLETKEKGIFFIHLTTQSKNTVEKFVVVD